MRVSSMLLVVAVAALAGCSDNPSAPSESPAPSDSSAGHAAAGHTGGSAELAVSAEGFFPVNPTLSPVELNVQAGATVSVTFSNNDVNPLIGHNWVLEGVEGSATETIQPGQSTSLDFVSPHEAGDYAYFCAIGNHRAMGMEGTLHVAA